MSPLVPCMETFLLQPAHICFSTEWSKEQADKDLQGKGAQQGMQVCINDEQCVLQGRSGSTVKESTRQALKGNICWDA